MVKKMKEYTVEEFAKVYQCFAMHDGRLHLTSATGKPFTKAEKEYIGIIKPKVMEYLKQKEKEETEKRLAIEKERQDKINTIEGLKEIQKLNREWEVYHDKFNEAMERGNGECIHAPRIKVSELIKLYPRAAAYLKAESYAKSAHYSKSHIGKKALEDIINGSDFKKCIEDMENEWENECRENACR